MIVVLLPKPYKPLFPLLQSTMSPPNQSVDLDVLPEQVGNKLSYAHEDDGADDPSSLTREELAFVRDFPQDKKKKVLWKVDVRLVPFLTLLYLFAYIDRANIGEHLLLPLLLLLDFMLICDVCVGIGNAKIEGLVEDVGMTDDQYRICLSIFYVPYILFGKCAVSCLILG